MRWDRRRDASTESTQPISVADVLADAIDPSWLVLGYRNVLKKTQKSFSWMVIEILQTTFVSLSYWY